MPDPIKASGNLPVPSEDLSPTPNRKNAMGERLKLVAQWLLDFHTRGEIVAMCVSKWGIGERQAVNYIKAIHDYWEECAPTKDIAKLREEARARIEAIARSAMNGKQLDKQGNVVDMPDRRTALNAARTLAQLDGLFAPTRHEITSPLAETAADQIKKQVAEAIKADPSLLEGGDK